MDDKAFDSYLLVKFVPDWIFTSNMIEKLESTIFSDDYIVFFDLDSDFVTFFINDIGRNSISLDNFNLDDVKFYYCNPETINQFSLMGWYNKSEQRKALTVVFKQQHGWIGACPKMRKKEKNQFLLIKLKSVKSYWKGEF